MTDPLCPASVRISGRSAVRLLVAGVGQVIEIDLLAVPIHPGRDDAEAVEAGTGRLRAQAQSDEGRAR